MGKAVVAPRFVVVLLRWKKRERGGEKVYTEIKRILTKREATERNVRRNAGEIRRGHGAGKRGDKMEVNEREGKMGGYWRSEGDKLEVRQNRSGGDQLEKNKWEE